MTIWHVLGNSAILGSLCDPVSTERHSVYTDCDSWKRLKGKYINNHEKSRIQVVDAMRETAPVVAEG